MQNTVVTMREARSTDAPPSAAAAPADARADSLRPRPPTARHAFVPLLLGLTAVLAWVGFQAWGLEQDRRQLQQARSHLQPTLDQAARVRQSLDLLAADTQRLADAGHTPARALVDELARRGITIQTATATAAPAAASGSGR